MLARTLTTPTTSRCWVRGLSTVLVPSRTRSLPLNEGPQGVPFFVGQSPIRAQDSGRSFSIALPTQMLSFQDRFQRPLYALHVQAAYKASLPSDPERPKRPLTSYLRFAAAQREKGVKDVKTIAAAWRQLSAAEKKPFEEAGAADKAAYQKDFEKYKASGKYDAWKRDPAKPKRPLAAFIIWAQEQRAQPRIKSLSVAESGKLLGAEWKQMSAAQKAPFEQKYKAAKESYDAQMKVYHASGAETKWLEKTGRLAITKKIEAKKQAQKDKIKLAKEKKMAQKAKIQEKAKAAKAKAAQAKAAKDEARKVQADKIKAAKAKAAKVKKAKLEVAKARAAKLKAAKAATVKAAREKAAKAKEAKAAKAKALKAQKAAKATAPKAAAAAKAKDAGKKTADAKRV